jgi:hypothetical protein
MHFPPTRWLKRTHGTDLEADPELLRSWVTGVPMVSEVLPRMMAEIRRARRHERSLCLLAVVVGGLHTPEPKPGVDLNGEDGVGADGRARSERIRAKRIGVAPSSSNGPRPSPQDFFLSGLLIRSATREIDIVACMIELRTYVVFLPETDIRGGQEAANRIRAAIQDRVRVAPAVGSASFPGDGYTVEDLLDRARSSVGEGLFHRVGPPASRG